MKARVSLQDSTYLDIQEEGCCADASEDEAEDVTAQSDTHTDGSEVADETVSAGAIAF